MQAAVFEQKVGWLDAYRHPGAGRDPDCLMVAAFLDSILRSVNGASLHHSSILRSVNGASLHHSSSLRRNDENPAIRLQ
jgi:hypothetical protein